MFQLSLAELGGKGVKVEVVMLRNAAVYISHKFMVIVESNYLIHLSGIYTVRDAVIEKLSV